MQELHLNSCLELTDEAVEAVVQFCPNISIFLFPGCPKLTGKMSIIAKFMALSCTVGAFISNVHCNTSVRLKKTSGLYAMGWG